MAFFLNRKNAKEKKLGIYIHIPFCKSRCAYCDFYSNGGAMEPTVVDSYLQALSDHIRENGKLSNEYVVDTLYFGGGTPSYFGADNLDKIMDEIHRSFRMSKDAEITFEANPDSMSERELRKLLRTGFNRISIGVQSADDTMLETLGRPHSFQQAKIAMETARKVGFANISLDLMYALPGQDLASWLHSVEAIVALRPEHISCYALTVEENTPFGAMKDKLLLANDEQQLRMYLHASQYLREHGYEHYEISNFAKKGFQSRHNMKYWDGEEYLGFGPSASSYFGGKRFTMMPDLKGYIEGISKRGQVVTECETIPLRAKASEYLMLRLRTNKGLEPAEYERKFRMPFEPLRLILERCAAMDYAIFENGVWKLTERGWFISNTIIVQLQEEQERTAYRL